MQEINQITIFSLDIKCGDTKISSKKSVRYLGVDLEQTLSGKLILENILKNGNSLLKFLRRQAKCLNLASKRLLSSAINLMSHGLCMLFMVPWFAKDPKARITNPSE